MMESDMNEVAAMMESDMKAELKQTGVALIHVTEQFQNGNTQVKSSVCQ